MLHVEECQESMQGVPLRMETVMMVAKHYLQKII